MEFITQYKQLQKAKPAKLREHIRNASLHILSYLAEIDKDKWLSKPRIQFLYIHHIFEDEEVLLHSLLQSLSKHHTFISYSEAVSRILSGDIDKPYISLSSDDGFKNNLNGAKIMNEYGAKCCFFINPGIIEEKNYEKIKHFCQERIHFPPVEYLTWKEVEDLQKMGHEIGSHTMNHINIAATDLALVKADLQETFEILKHRCGDVAHFAYPYGRYFHFNQAAFDAVFEAGYTSCACAERGCHIASSEPIDAPKLFLRRDHLILHRDLSFLPYFMVQNSKNASISKNLSPYI